MSGKKDAGKGKELTTLDNELVAEQLPLAPTGGRILNFFGRIHAISSTIKIKATTLLRGAEEELYDQTVKTFAAHEAARMAQVRFNHLHHILQNENERLELELSVAQSETMQELRARAKALGLSENRAEFAIEKGLADVEKARKQLKPGIEQIRETTSAEDRLCELYEERKRKAVERWKPHIDNATTERGKAEAEASLRLEQTALREWFSREFNKLLGNI